MASPSARRGPEPAPEPEELFERLGVHITAETLERALTHRSFAYEQGGLPTNERLEFLGDSVLGYVVTDHIFTVYPDLAEGDLARRRAAVVSTRALAKVARRIGIGPFVRLGTGERRTGGADKDSILADTLEALIGAVYVDHGAVAAAALVHRHVVPLLDEPDLLRESTDWKTVVAEAASRHTGVMAVGRTRRSFSSFSNRARWTASWSCISARSWVIASRPLRASNTARWAR